MTPTTIPAQTPTGVEVLRFLDVSTGQTDLNGRELAEVFEVTTRAMRMALARLEDGGLIDVERRRPSYRTGDSGRTLTITAAGRMYLALTDAAEVK